MRRPFNVLGAQDHKKSALDNMTNMASPMASPMTRSLKLNGPKLPLLLAPVRSTMNAAYCNTIAVGHEPFQQPALHRHLRQPLLILSRIAGFLQCLRFAASCHVDKVLHPAH